MTPKTAVVVAFLGAALVVEGVMILAGVVGRTREPACVGDSRLVPDRGDCTPWRMTEHGEERVCRLVCVRRNR